MTRQHASDLSPAQRLLSETRVQCDLQCDLNDLNLHYPSSSEAPLKCEYTLDQVVDSEETRSASEHLEEHLNPCQIQAVKNLFIHALRWCEETTDERSWQRRRLYALLSPMYLEIATQIDPGPHPPSGPQELLSISRAWGAPTLPECTLCNRAQQRALNELQTLLAEMIGESTLE